MAEDRKKMKIENSKRQKTNRIDQRKKLESAASSSTLVRNAILMSSTGTSSSSSEDSTEEFQCHVAKHELYMPYIHTGYSIIFEQLKFSSNCLVSKKFALKTGRRTKDTDCDEREREKLRNLKILRYFS